MLLYVLNEAGDITLHKIIASVSLMMCLSSSVSAMDYRDLNHGCMLHNIGWETDNMSTNSNIVAGLREQIRKLEEENEQLRNSVSRLVAGQGRVTKSTKSDPRIQALVEENKRLMALLKNNESRKSTSSVSESVYAEKIAILRNENQKLNEENSLLKEALNQRDNGANRIVVLQKQIKELREQNSDLQSKLIERDNYRVDKRLLNEKNIEISSLKDRLAELDRENKRLNRSVSKNSQKKEFDRVRADKIEAAYKNNLKALEILNNRLDKLKSENKKLLDDLSKKNIQEAGISEQISALKLQNKSLRDTIKAQNEELLSADNAIKTAERLLTENKILKRNIELSSKASISNNKTVQELVERNKKLLNGIMERDKYIKKLEGLKETVKLLRQENDKLLLVQKSNSNNDIEYSELLSQNNSLQGQLDKERENIVLYRTKIKEYQDKLASMSDNDVWESKINDLKDEVTSLKLENQELKARIDILLKDKDSVVFHKADIYFDDNEVDSVNLLDSAPLNNNIGFIRGKKKAFSTEDVMPEGQESVTYIDAKYPPVNEVMPILGEDGNHINALNILDGKPVESDNNGITQDTEDMSLTSDNIKPEDLLAQELNPLTDVR